MVPSGWLPPGVPFTDHVTDELNVPVPWTLTANCCLFPGRTLMLAGTTVTEVMLPGGGGGDVLLEPPPQDERVREKTSRINPGRR